MCLHMALGIRMVMDSLDRDRIVYDTRTEQQKGKVIRQQLPWQTCEMCSYKWLQINVLMPLHKIMNSEQLKRGPQLDWFCQAPEC